MPNWLLPEFIADVLPAEARKMEEIRRKVLDAFRSYGYELVVPPMLEYLESLLTGVGQDTEIYTFKLIDQLSGRTMGIRADMTTQVARIDAHLLNRNAVTRLCYAGSILHTRPSGLQGTREPLQIGAEIFGYPGIEADAEIQDLALTSLKAANITGVCLDLLPRRCPEIPDCGRSACPDIRGTAVRSSGNQGYAGIDRADKRFS